MALTSNKPQFVDVMSDAAAQAYRSANPSVIPRVLGPWPYYSMVKPNDSKTLPVIGGCGTAGEPQLFNPPKIRP